MNELITQLTQKTGISEKQAQQAVQTMVGFLKQRLPAAIASQLENAISGQGAQGGKGMGGAMGQAQQSAGGMFGGDQPTPPRP